MDRCRRWWPVYRWKPANYCGKHFILTMQNPFQAAATVHLGDCITAVEGYEGNRLINPL